MAKARWGLAVDIALPLLAVASTATAYWVINAGLSSRIQSATQGDQSSSQCAGKSIADCLCDPKETSLFQLLHEAAPVVFRSFDDLGHLKGCGACHQVPDELIFRGQVCAAAKIALGDGPPDSFGTTQLVQMITLLGAAKERDTWKEVLDNDCKGLAKSWREGLYNQNRRFAPPSGAFAWTHLAEPYDPVSLRKVLICSDRSAPLGFAAERAVSDFEATVQGLMNRIELRASPWRYLQVALNGGIQWITIACFFWALFALVRTFALRSWTWRDFSRREGASTVQHIFEASLMLPDYLMVVIPMLGFIGTIFGMGAAMGGAGAIVGTRGAELQRAIQVLSRNLGTAFDTTLVALLANMVLELVRMLVRRLEYRQRSEAPPPRKKGC